MGIRGPLPRTAAEKVARGNPNRKPIAFTVQDNTPVEVPDCPAVLKGAARDEWARVTRALEAQGRIAATDRAVLTAHCAAWGRFLEVEGLLNEYVGIGSRGHERSDPLFAVWSKLHERLLASSAALGLNVAARLRLPGQEPEKNDDPFEELLKRGRQSAN